MIKRREFLACCLVVLMAMGGARAESLGDDAGNFITSMADKAIAALTEEGISRDKRVARFRQLLNENFAVKSIGRWVLGRYWRKATYAERSEYLILFENLIVTSYVDRFERYSGETLTVTKTVVNKSGDAIVYSQITRSQGIKPVKVGWRVRARKGQYKIVDVIVEGISMGQTQRSEFASVIRNNGGNAMRTSRSCQRDPISAPNVDNLLEGRGDILL